ncbi:MAG: hypothetical protein MMC33_000438 [Icmadophila ericetorum]|nr:hypothetical protein [Icmadophila ericetorum]
MVDTCAADEFSRVWASVLVDGDDLSKGFKPWLTENVGGTANDFETVAYGGPKDLRYPILAVAMVKVGKKLLLCSPFATMEGQKHIPNVTDCKVYLYADASASVVRSIIGDKQAVRALQVPQLNEWVYGKEFGVFSYEKTWEKAQLDPWIIFHTSCTTGLPRSILYKNLMMVQLDATEITPDADVETMSDHL